MKKCSNFNIVYEEAVSYLWLCNPPFWISLYIWGKFDFLFYQCTKDRLSSPTRDVLRAELIWLSILNLATFLTIFCYLINNSPWIVSYKVIFFFWQVYLPEESLWYDFHKLSPVSSGVITVRSGLLWVNYWLGLLLPTGRKFGCRTQKSKRKLRWAANCAEKDKKNLVFPFFFKSESI